MTTIPSKAAFDVTDCALCPRACHADRTRNQGFCHGGDGVRVAKIMLHHWEEPCISCKNGSGAVFFSGCTLGCMFCQNHEISTGQVGKVYTVENLAQAFLDLQEQGAENINLVTGDHYIPWIVQALDLVKSRLQIPVVWNGSGYMNGDMLSMLDGYIDIYLTDYKYTDETGRQLAKCQGYQTVALPAIAEMIRQCGKPQFHDDKLLRGVIIRHLILPGFSKESLELLEALQTFSKEDFLLSVMRQYTPPKTKLPMKHLNRRLYSFEYERVLQYVIEQNIQGYMQGADSAVESYTPNF